MPGLNFFMSSTLNIDAVLAFTTWSKDWKLDLFESHLPFSYVGISISLPMLTFWSSLKKDSTVFNVLHFCMNHVAGAAYPTCLDLKACSLQEWTFLGLAR